MDTLKWIKKCSLNLINGHFKMNKENVENLKEVYEYVYTCKKCKSEYGSDLKESPPHFCPNCE